MLQEAVAVEEVDLRHRRLGHEIEDVAAGPTEPDDGQTHQRQPLGVALEAGAGARGVDVAERRCVVVG